MYPPPGSTRGRDAPTNERPKPGSEMRLRNVGYVLFDGAQNRRLLVLAEDGLVKNSSDSAADERSDPEQPELPERPSSDEECRTCAARRVHRGVRDRD